MSLRYSYGNRIQTSIIGIRGTSVTIFHVLKYSISAPPKRADIAALPAPLRKEWDDILWNETLSSLDWNRVREEFIEVLMEYEGPL